MKLLLARVGYPHYWTGNSGPQSDSRQKLNILTTPPTPTPIVCPYVLLSQAKNQLPKSLPGAYKVFEIWKPGLCHENGTDLLCFWQSMFSWNTSWVYCLTVQRGIGEKTKVFMIPCTQSGISTPPPFQCIPFLCVGDLRQPEIRLM